MTTTDALAAPLVAVGFTDVAHRTATGWQRDILPTFAARQSEDLP